jgi:hypothetical protein
VSLGRAAIIRERREERIDGAGSGPNFIGVNAIDKAAAAIVSSN